MDENYNVQEADFEDTIPENATEENEDIGNEEEGIVTPDDDELAEENVVREEEIGTHKSSSEKRMYRSRLFRYSIITRIEISQKTKQLNIFKKVCIPRI